MANFGARLAYPRPTPSRVAYSVPIAAAHTPRGLAAHVVRRARRVLDAMFRSLDEAPYGLAWPPSPGGLARPAWVLPVERERAAAMAPAPAWPGVRERRRPGRPLDDFAGRRMRQALA
jgi:hypothetical protein